jgi:nucleoside-diphosphate-sugar epimerase
MFYLADYEPISLRKWIDALAAAQGARNPVTLPLPLARLLAWTGDVIGLVRPFPFNSFRLRNMRAEYVFDLDATRAVCGPGPYSFDEAVERTVAWHKAKERAHPE